jgi:O-antigen ligase
VLQKIIGELKKNDLSFYCLLTVVSAAVASGFGFSLSWQILCMFVLLACFSFLFIKKSFVSKDIYIVFLLLAAIFASYFGADFQVNVRTASLGFLNAVLAFFILSYCDERNKENVLITILIFSIWISFLLFVQSLYPGADPANAAILNADIAAGFLILAYPLSFSFFEKNKYPLVFLSLSFLIFVAIITSKSFPAAIIAYLVSFFYFIRLRKNAFFKIFFAAVSLFALTAAVYVFKSKAVLYDFENIVIWQKTAWLIFKDNPIFGAGFGNFGALFAYYRPEFAIDTSFTRNIFSQLLSEIGIVGLLAFFAAGFIIVKNAVSSSRESVNVSCMVSAAAFLVLNLAGFAFFAPSNAMVFFIICAAAFNAVVYPREKKSAVYLILIPVVFLVYIFSVVFIAEKHFQQGNALSGAGNFSKAGEQYLKAVKYDVKNAYYWQKSAENEMFAKNFEEAVRQLSNAEKYYRHSAAIKAETAYMYKILGDEENALKYAKLATECDKFNIFLQKQHRKTKNDEQN